ncbi:MAG: DUF4256 domain-containing protein, partial [Bacteroidales bacterium]|nr:DUF4256 domain-containing protein [Bacteroidales bacterium]
LKKRFESNMARHQGIDWAVVENKLHQCPEKLWSLNEMELTGGEPDIVGYDKLNNEYLFFDCSPESPKGRRSICYDLEGLESRKEHAPLNNAIDLAKQMGVEILSEQEYIELQKLGQFDTKTSSWLKTPPEIRSLGGALFGDYRYGRVFIYHNGASSYYSVRAFRACLKL